MIFYTSINNLYLPKAVALAKSVKAHNPSSYFVLLLSDSKLSGSSQYEIFDEIIEIKDLNIPNFETWCFKHTVVELCTAVKGPALLYLLNKYKSRNIVYLDPDIKVFASLSFIDQKLEHHDILLTPHLLHPEESEEAIIDNELSALKHGVFNLGFVAVANRPQGYAFAKWWADRLMFRCYDDIPNGIFTDQKWCDLAPCYFSRLHILREIGCNVATWNISHRKISYDINGALVVNGKEPLYFYHFTGFDSGAGHGMLVKYGSESQVLHQLWEDYNSELYTDENNMRWKYGFFNDGSSITNEMRKVYSSRHDLQNCFQNPYEVHPESYYSWFKLNTISNVSQPAASSNFFVRAKLFYIRHGLKQTLKKCINYLTK